MFNGPTPTIRNFDSYEKEIECISTWLRELLEEGFESHEIGIFVRSENEIERAESAIEKSCLPYKFLDSYYIQLAHGSAALCTMHLAKGLEFRNN